MRPALAALGIVFSLPLAAVESYTPSQHPAQVERRITAYTEPIHTLSLAAEHGGRIIAVTHDVGDAIPADASAVIRLNPVLADLAVTQAEAALRSAEAMLAARKADHDQHQAEAAFAEREFARSEALARDGRTPEQTRDARGLDRDRARIALTSDVAAIAGAEADLQAAQARLAEAQEQRRRHDIAAPSGWIITDRLREVGSMVAPGDPILHLADVSRLVLAYRLDPDEVLALRALAEAKTITLSIAGSTEPVVADLRRIDVTFDPVSRKRLAELTINSSLVQEASGGLAAELSLNIPDPAGGWSIPAAYVEWRFERAVVRDEHGVEHILVPLRRTASHIVVAGDALPADVRLVALD